MSTTNEILRTRKRIKGWIWQTEKLKLTYIYLYKKNELYNTIYVGKNSSILNKPCVFTTNKKSSGNRTKMIKNICQLRKLVVNTYNKHNSPG